MSVVPITGMVKRAWIPLIVLVVLAVSGLVVSRFHRQFASQNLHANAGAGIEIVQFNPKIMIYDVYGSGTAQISYFDPDANVHLVSVPLPWSITLSTTLPTVSGSLMAQTTGDQVGCKVGRSKPARHAVPRGRFGVIPLVSYSSLVQR